MKAEGGEGECAIDSQQAFQVSPALACQPSTCIPQANSGAVRLEVEVAGAVGGPWS
jgi:hypothetical protein